MDATTETGELVAHMVVAVAQWEPDDRAPHARGADREPPAPGPRARPAPPEVVAIVRDATAEGLSLSATAARLNEYGRASLGGGRWPATSVRRLLARLSGA